ncbi:transcription regulator HTH, apses-type DNA-binding domain-containing protein [Cokeromyces recurvatus]|uniref:transcription regulator HTH, apses-type DNA-binding domain-containing protein n=1 Tax=Cokeromyces recurvatus TaxID=90255 RepID=UPI00221FEBE9|nr:transcription regulator HTH, apses-type DNA-binding domain-containing protein [Cokeromyces recurvatus]KAI7907816.1 transcription regulator HTH, apses-type DNA-binding domain-containing protein [Cokeromyces recurvatus]
MSGNNSLSSKDTWSYCPCKSEKYPQFDIKMCNYSTSLDPRGYIPVYQYNIKDVPVMWDRETGYVHFTGIWKILGNTKTDIVKIMDANPNLKTKKIRGGFLQIQGTWVPYKEAHLLCKRNAWNVRNELIPIFGQSFPFEALSPNHEDFGCLWLDPKKKDTNNIKKNSSLIKNTSYTTASTSRSSSMKPYTRYEIRKSIVRRKPPMNYIPTRQNSLSSTESNISAVAQFIDKDSLLSDDMISLSDDSSSAHSCQITPIHNKLSLLPNTFHTTTTSQYSICPNTTMLMNSSTFFPLLSHINQEKSEKEDIEIVQAALALQRLSQDDGTRPFPPFDTEAIPSKIILNNQEFTIVWD